MQEVFLKQRQDFNAFYTGYNREFLKAGKTSQTLLHATSKDGITWEKSKEALEIPPQEGYDKRNWRDPFVLWDEEREEYLLILEQEREKIRENRQDVSYISHQKI